MNKITLTKKLDSLAVVICGLIIFIIYLIDIKNDYYYFATHQKTIATIENIEKTEKYNPYKITLIYFNNNSFQNEKCSLFIKKKKGKELIESNQTNVTIAYTKQSSCDIYISDYKLPSKGMLVIRTIILIISGCGVIIFFLKTIKNERT